MISSGLRGAAPGGRTAACRLPGRAAALAAAAAVLILPACGKRGAPQAPLRVRPAAVEEFTLRQRGDSVVLMLKEPKSRTDGSAYAEEDRILLRLTRVPESALDPAHGRGARRTARQAAGGVGVSWVLPRGDWPRYRKGGRLEISIPLDSLELGPPGGSSSLVGRNVGFVAEVQEGSRKKSLLAGPARISLCNAPAAPEELEARIAEGGILLWWRGGGSPPATAHLYRAEKDRPFPIRPYRRIEAGVDRFLDPVPPSGQVFRYQVRFGAGEKSIQCESDPAEASAAAVDLFPPARPAGLAAAAEDSLIRLFWSPGTEPDLAGYLVYRSEGPEEPFRRLTPEPITATTYADTEVGSGRRYVYVVSAVDNATPPNESRWSRPAAENLP